MVAVLESKRLIAAFLAVTVGGVGAAVLGTYSTYTTAKNSQENVSAGVFAFNIGDPSVGSQFATDISGLAPGDFGDRLLDLTNTGGVGYSSVTLAATAVPSSLLDTDATNGLRVSVDRSSVAWTQASNSVAASCSGTITPLTAVTPLPTLKSTGATWSTGLTTLVGGTNAVDHLAFHYSLPAAADGVSGLTTTMKYTFTASQAPGGAYR